MTMRNRSQAGREVHPSNGGGGATACQDGRGFLLATRSQRLKRQMPQSRRHLRVVGAEPAGRSCRTTGCALARATVLGFCPFCQGVYDAAQELHRRRLEWCWARIEDAWRPLIGGLTSERREQLQAHLAAHAAQPGGLSMRAIEDFLAELHDRAISEKGA